MKRAGIIAPHRSMAGLSWTTGRLPGTLALSLGGSALVVALLPRLGQLWQFLFERIRDGAGLPLPLGDQRLAVPGGPAFTIPMFAVTTPMPGSRELLVAGAVVALALLLSFVLPERFTPLRYFLRLLAVVQGTAIVFFAVSAEPFPYRLIDHVSALLQAGLVVMALVPPALGLTLHVFDLAFWKKLLLTLAILLHLAVFVPLQAMVHLWLVLHGSAVVMPVLFLVFGVLLDVMICVAFYGWALSWQGQLERRPPARPVRLSRKGAPA